MSESKKKSWVKRHKAWSSIIGVFILICVIGALGSNKTPTSNNTSSNASAASKSSTSSSTAAVAKLNQPADDGKFQFTVTSMQCDVTEIDQPGDTDWTATSGNPYCELNLSIKDISTVGQSFDDDAQNIYSNTGNQYSVDDDATIAANNSNSNCMDDPTVNPGVTITCTLAFDVPASVTPAYAMLHDSQLSDGVRVNIQ